MADEENHEALDAELAFIQKKIADGVARKQKETEGRHQNELESLRKEHAERHSAAEREHQREAEALRKEFSDTQSHADRDHRSALDKLERDLRDKFRDESEAKTERLTAEFAEEFAKQEQTLKAQLTEEKRQIEEELKRRSDMDLARDKRDLEETFQARLRKREEEMRAKADEDLRVREAELRRALDLEFRQKLEESLRTKIKELQEADAKEVAKQLETDKVRLETEYSRKIDAEEARLTRQHREEFLASEKDLKERMSASLDSERRKIEEGLRVRLLRRGRYSHLSRALRQPIYPFTAMVGLDKAKRALLLNAVNPTIGGVVMWGAEGNGKFSMLLSFAELMSTHEKALVGREDEHKAWNDEERYLVGRIHYGREMAGYLIDTYLQSAALSLPRTRRHHEASGNELPPLLLSTLKEEDEQAYHLISEYTLHVEVASPNSVEERLEIMHRNSDFRKDPTGFGAKYAGAGQEVQAGVTGARDRLPQVSISTKILALIARMTILDKQSARLDVLMEQLARTNAAFDGRTEVDSSDVMEAADLALMHRLTPRELSEFERTSGGPESGAFPRPR